MNPANTTPFSGLYAPIPNVDAYLSRIGYHSERACREDVLSALMRAHTTSVPFENLDIFYNHKEPDLSTAALFEKLVTRRRGGYCFELNGLFSRLLSALGFSVSLISARIVKGDFLSPPSHEAIIVEISGKRFFCDVGFGGPSPSSAIELAYDSVQACAAGRKYRFSKRGKLTALQIEKNGEFSDMMMLDETPCDPVDFIPMNAFCAYSEKEPFVHKPMVWLGTEGGKISLDGQILRVISGEDIFEKRLKTEEEISVALRDHFGIEF